MSFWYQNGVCSNNTHSHRLNNKKNTVTRQKVGAFACLCGIGVVAHAQDTLPAGMIASFDITQRMEYSDNPDLETTGDPDFFGRTVLGFGLESVTALQTFSLDLGTDIEEFRDNQSGVDVDNSSLRLAYDRATGNANLGVSLRYRESDAQESDFLDDFPIDGNVIDQSTGTRKSYGYTLSGAVGVEAPIGAGFDLSYSEIAYSGANDTDLTDQNDTRFNGQIDFRIDPRIVARLTGKYEDFDAEGNGVNRETTGVGAGVVLDITQTLVTDLAVSQDRIERSGDETGIDEGLSFDGSLVQSLKNGTLGLSLSSDISSNDSGRRNRVSIDREMDLPSGSLLSYSLGLTRSAETGTDPLLNLTYIHALPTAEVSVGLSQEVASNSDNEEAILTSLQAGYTQRINSLSNLGANLSFFDRNELGLNPDDGQRIEVSLSYDYALTRDWALVSGVSHTIATSDKSADRSRNTIFVGLRRTFTWAP